MIAKNSVDELNNVLLLFANQTLMGRIITRYPELARTINNYKRLYELEVKDRRDSLIGERPRLEDFIDDKTGDGWEWINAKYQAAVLKWEKGVKEFGNWEKGE